jgi:4-hydroxybenzoyl-CoA reductase subunit alpha
VAAVFATDRRIAEFAAGKVVVDYEPLEAVYDPKTAVGKDAPLLHERYEGNINTEVHQDFGDVDQAFSDAAYVREDVFQGQRTHQAYMEPPAALALEEGDLVTIRTANQNPHLVQVQLSRVLGIPQSNLRVIRPALGGGFGGKAETTKLEFLSVIAARKLKKPVLMVMDRKQAFLHGRGRHAQTIRMKSGFDKKGKLLATHEQVTLDGGAYTSYGIITTYYSGNLLPILYKLPNFRFDAQRICTNLPTCGAMRGNGTPQPRFAFESHLDMAAADLGISPVEIRERNIVEENYTTINELRITSCGLDQCLRKVAEISKFDRKFRQLPEGKGIGIGLGSFVSGAGYPIIRGDFPHSACAIRVGEDGQRVFLYSGASEIGQGSDTVLCQIAAEEIGIAYEDVTIFSSDSAITPTDLGTYASRVTFMAGNAVIDAARGVKRQLTEFWSETMGPVSGELRFSKGNVSDGSTTVPFSELATKFFRSKGPLMSSGIYNPPKLGGSFKGAAVGTSPAYSFCAMVAEVDVDTETGEVTVEHVHAAHDSGTVINPITFHGQVEGSITMGLGETLMESVEHIDGHIRNPNFHDYLIPTIADIPEIHSVTVPVRDPNGPFGAKEVGEGSILPVMGAIANAIEDAVGARITTLPITAEKVLWAMKAAKRSN